MSETIESATTHRGHILIIDDDRIALDAVNRALTDAGFRVSQALDGVSGLLAAQRLRPDLILFDLHDAALDGFELCRRLRMLNVARHTPLVFLTTLHESSDIDRAFACGANDFITKPVNAQLLVARIVCSLRMIDVQSDARQRQVDLARAQQLARIGNWSWQAAPEQFDCSDEYHRLTGLPRDRPIRSFEQMLASVHPADSARVAAALSAAWQSGSPYSLGYRIVRPDGSIIDIQELVRTTLDAKGRIAKVEGTIQDVTERIADRERIRELSECDSLTGLTNRTQFCQAIRPTLSNAILRGRLAAALSIDIDRFLRINETLGLAAGDQVLQEVAQRIRGSVRLARPDGPGEQPGRSDLFARMNGDEFAVLVTDLQRPQDAETIAQRILNEIARPIEVGEQQLSVTACIGIALSNRIGIDANSLLRDSESALRLAKQSRPGSIMVHVPDQIRTRNSSLSLEQELRQGLAERQFLLHYQPRFDLHNTAVVGAEALIRWQHPQRGLVMPLAFIDLAEEIGLIEPITVWVLDEVCRQQAAWRDAGLDIVPISINFSSLSFRGAGPSNAICQALERHGLTAAALEIEITESVMMQDIDAAACTLSQLRSMGLDLAIDDFGTGFSSLMYLKRLPLSVLKIDRAFVKDVLVDTHDAAIATAIVALSQAIGLRVVAEGVESNEQVRFLLGLGCHLMQGYLFSRPIDAGAFATLLRDGLKLPAGLGAVIAPAGATAVTDASLGSGSDSESDTANTRVIA